MYNKFVNEVKEKNDLPEKIILNDSITDNMSINQKWLYLIFKKDTY
jgi:hypothetical protein